MGLLVDEGNLCIRKTAEGTVMNYGKDRILC